MRSNIGRQTILVISAIVFIVIAIGSLFKPHLMASQLGYVLNNVDALSEFRAVYVGIWFATAILLIVAAKRINFPLIADLGALLILGQTFGRIISIAIDGFPSEKIWPVLILELVGGMAILLIRPKQLKENNS
ncbi:MAG: DUF4345 domain-containing protein [Acidobacteria bacterium]|nr:DUF4345 domain-containing protein [Acidobacteriota bacterium]